MSKLMSIHNSRPVGFWLQCQKGHWTIDGEAADPEMRVAVLLQSWEDGEICFDDNHKVSDQRRQLVDTHGLFGPPRAGYNKTTSVMVVDSAGGLGTYTSTSWGGHYAVMGILQQYEMRKMRAFPICALKTKARGDQYGNIDPVFHIVGWARRSDFDAILGPAPEVTPAIEAPKPKPEPVKKSSAEIIDDSIPF